MKLGRVTQRMVNEFPDWSSIRSDEQSLGFQLTNIIGNEAEELDKQNHRLGKNYFLPTVNLSEIDLVYSYELGGNFEFTSDESNSANTIFTAPLVTGDITADWYDVSGNVTSPADVTIAPDNDIRSFWYDSVPSRLRPSTHLTSSHTVLSPTAVSSSPFTTLTLPHLPGRLAITLSGGVTFLALDENNNLVRTLVVISGVTRKGIEEEETLAFVYNGTKQTVKEWKQLTSVKVYGVSPNTTTIGIRSARFNDGPYLDFYNLDSSPQGTKVDTMWNLGTNTLSHKTLDLIRFTSDDPNNLLLGFSEQQVFRQIELLTTAGASITSLLDLAIEPFSNRIWTCSNVSLFVYDVELPYPNMKVTSSKQYDSLVRLELDSYHKVQGDSVEISYIFARPIKQISKHRTSIKYPDGSSYGILNGSTVSISSDFWVTTAQTGREFRPSDILPLPQRGEYLLTLEVTYLDGTTNTDQRIVAAESLTAINEYHLFGSSVATEGRTIAGLDFDSDQRLWILDSTGDKWLIEFGSDVMIVDYEQKVIYFKENYSSVSVTA